MRVLVIEDSTQLAGLVGRELEQELGCEVSCARDPVEALAGHRDHEFDLAIVDLLYEHLNRDFEARRIAGTISLTSASLLVTGLAAVHRLTVPRRDAGVVIWTSGEANRRLHLLFAYEDLAARVFCSKSSGTGRADTLMEALKAAADGRSYVDPVLNSYLPAEGQPAIRDTILREASKRAVWRALAIGARTRGQISEITGYSSRHVGNLIPAMFDDLARLDAGLAPSEAPMADVISYASRNWEFFLDDTVRAMYPLHVTFSAADGNRDVQRVSIDMDLEAHAVPDAAAGRVRDGGTATTRIRKDDAGQVAESMRHRNGDLADRDV